MADFDRRTLLGAAAALSAADALPVAWNPVRARLVERPAAWRYASTRAHLAGRDDPLPTAAPMLARAGDFAAFLTEGEDAAASDALRASETTGLPVGDRLAGGAGAGAGPAAGAARAGAQGAGAGGVGVGCRWAPRRDSLPISATTLARRDLHRCGRK